MIYRDSSSSNVIVSIYNYGVRNIVIDKIYIERKNVEYLPSGIEIPSGEIINIKLSSATPDTGYLTIITESNNRYETYYEL
jgi:hypothetical protein